MTFDWKAGFAFILARLNERTTWLGLIALATALGLQIAPEHYELIVQAGLVTGGFIAVVVKDKPTSIILQV